MQAQSTMNRRNLRMREREVARIPIEAIRPNPYQPRRVFAQEALEELCASIKQYGLLQPISVRKAGNDAYELIAGERRLRACRMAGMTAIDAIVFLRLRAGQRGHRHDGELAAGKPALHGGGGGLSEPDSGSRPLPGRAGQAPGEEPVHDREQDAHPEAALDREAHAPAVQSDGAPRARPAPPARRGDANQDW